MAYTFTQWGYEIDGTLAPLIDPVSFNELTAGAWEGDERVAPAIAAASAAIRNYCGWHVSPSATCRATIDTDGSASLWLPARNVSGITSVKDRGTSVTDYEWSRLGQVKPACRIAPGLQAATVEYTAGIPVTGDLLALVAGVVAHTVALTPTSYGVVSETAGGVSLTRAQGAAYGGVAATLTDMEKEALAPYKVGRSHAS